MCVVKCGVDADFNVSFSAMIKRTSVYVVYVPFYRCYTEVIKIFGLNLSYLSSICRTSSIYHRPKIAREACVSLSVYLLNAKCESLLRNGFFQLQSDGSSQCRSKYCFGYLKI